MRAPFSLALSLVAIGTPLAVSAQPADSLSLDTVTVTAERVPLEPDRSAAAVTVVTAEAIERRPVQNLADVLRLTPGFAFLGGDGAGVPPAATVRGFYGGGEAEYVLVLVDGRPINDVETGVVDWELVSLDAVERVEVVRGGASSLWGDAAVGAVVNVVTDGDLVGELLGRRAMRGMRGRKRLAEPPESPQPSSPTRSDRFMHSPHHP